MTDAAAVPPPAPKQTASLSETKVPVVQIMASNIKEVWPSLIHSVKYSSFIAIDLELSGLGDRKLLMKKHYTSTSAQRNFQRSVDDRYTAIVEAAKTRSVLALGVSCWRVTRDEPEPEYYVQTYNILLLSRDNYTVEPDALQFLVEHGFDFNKQYKEGVSYTPSTEDMIVFKEKKSPEPIRDLFAAILQAKCPVITHNGLIDLAFMYQSFYAPLPPTMSIFVADLQDMFKSGILDTKCVAEFLIRETATYLEYLFRKSSKRMRDAVAAGKPHLNLSFSEHRAIKQWVNLVECFACGGSSGKDLCETYANHGYCKDGKKCSKSHDVDEAINSHDHKSKKHKTEGKVPPIKSKHSNGDVVDTGCHRAGVDAFMTGFIAANYAVYLKAHPKKAKGEEEQKTSSKKSHYHSRDNHMSVTLEENRDIPLPLVLDPCRRAVNCLTLSGKNIPLKVMKSAFVKPSAAHMRQQHELNRKNSK
ncbi:hypothetical protein ACHWQZ_G016860 [Mnemiopsis leidyi]